MYHCVALWRLFDELFSLGGSLRSGEYICPNCKFQVRVEEKHSIAHGILNCLPRVRPCHQFVNVILEDERISKGVDAHVD